MAETVFRGPSINIGSLMDSRVEAFDGPDISYQGGIVPDPRFTPLPKDGMAPGRVKGFYNNPYFVVVDAILSANSTANVAAAQNPTAVTGTLLTLVTAVVGTAADVPIFTPGIPIVPVGTTSVATVAAIDFGFTTGTTATNSSTVIVVDNTRFTAGQWIVIGGAGAAAVTNIPNVCQVQAFSSNANSSIIFVSPVNATALNNAPIGQANLYSQFLPPGTQFGPATVTPTAVEPYRLAGIAACFDPAQGVARGLTIQAASIGSGTTAVLVTGFDIYGNSMTEVLTANGTTIQNGKKAFKYVQNIKVWSTATTVTPANVQIGVSDVVGLNMRSDKWEYLNIFWNGAWAQDAQGWTAALSTTSGLTTIDVRGSVNASTIVVLSTATLATASFSSNGARRLTVMMSVPFNNMINATPLNTVPLFGTPQGTGIL